MKKAILTISKITDKKNGYGMPIVEVNSTCDIKVINRGYNEFEAAQDIDESDLVKLRGHFQNTGEDTLMLEIKGPRKSTNCWYKLNGLYLGGERANMDSYRDWETDRKSTRLNSSHRL